MDRVLSSGVGLVALLAIVPRQSIAQQTSPSTWHLVYAVDSTGQTTYGEKARLLAAVRSGEPVRVGWGVAWKLPDGTVGGVEHVGQAAFVTIHHGEVFAQMPPMLGQTPNAREAIISFRTDGDRVWYALLDTTGRLRGYFTGGAEQRVTRSATYWYVPGPGDGAPSRLY